MEAVNGRENWRMRQVRRTGAKATGRRRVDEGRRQRTSAELADRLGAAGARGVADQGWRCECRAGDAMLEGACAVAVDDWGGGRSRC